MQNFDLTTPPQSGTGNKFLKIEQGNTRIRLYTTKGRTFLDHWLPIEKKTVGCSGAGACPHCAAGERAKKKAVIPVIDRRTNEVKVWEIGHQLMVELHSLDTMLKESGEAITDYNLVLQRGRPGENPLYRVRQADKVTGTQQEALDQSLIAANQIDLEQFVRKANPDTLGGLEG